MSSPFVAEIRIFPFNFAPRGWAFCAGQLLLISQNTALFSLLGTNYGGDGRVTFGLPNLQGNVPIHTTQYSGNSPFGQFALGQTGGEPAVTLLQTEMPAHVHTVQAAINAFATTAPGPSGGVPGNTTPRTIYSNSATPTSVPMHPAMIAIAGGSQPHNNVMPSLVMNYCIALQGIFPPRA